MADPAATTEVLTVKSAVCPGCSLVRLYWKGTSTTRPIDGVNKQELDEARKNVSSEFQATGATKKSVTKTSAGWTVDEHAGKTLCRLSGTGGRVVDSVDIVSNTVDTLTLIRKQRTPHPFDKTNLFDPAAMPYYVFESISNPSESDVATNLYDASPPVFVCGGCSKRYTVD